MGNQIIRADMRLRRAPSLGQLDEERDFGPRPIDGDEVPVDLRPRRIADRRVGSGYSIDPATGLPVPGTGGDLSQMINDVHAIAGLYILRRGLLGRVVTVTNSPTLIVTPDEDKGYLFLNPAGVVGLTATASIFSSQTLVGATTLLSGDVGVANYKSARFFLVASFGAGAGPVTFDLQTLDPVSGQFITAQTLFNMTATGNAYAFVDQMGIDTDFKILVTVPLGTTITFTMGAVLKDGLLGTSAGVTQTIFLGGNSGMSSVSGYPLLAGQEKGFYLMQNVNLYAVTAGPSLTLNVFEF